jgi:Ni,Fe-hydrogenase maturation factor
MEAVMNKKVVAFIELTKTLIDYIEEEQVYDKIADAGCGYIDSYRSEKFDRLIKEVKEAADKALKEVLSSSEQQAIGTFPA